MASKGEFIKKRPQSNAWRALIAIKKVLDDGVSGQALQHGQAAGDALA